MPLDVLRSAAPFPPPTTHDVVGRFLFSLGVRGEGVGRSDHAGFFPHRSSVGMQREQRPLKTGQPVLLGLSLGQRHLASTHSALQALENALLSESTALNTLLPLTIAFLPARSYFCLPCPMTIFSKKTSSFEMRCPLPSRGVPHYLWWVPAFRRK